MTAVSGPAPFYKSFGLKFFSDAFLKLISMIVAPIVLCVVVHAIAGAGAPVLGFGKTAIRSRCHAVAIAPAADRKRAD